MATSAHDKPFDVVSFVIDYEAGETTDEETVEGFQALIDSGAAWQLQGSYGRMAHALIEAGYCHASPIVVVDGV